MIFASRQDGGQQLGKFLNRRGVSADLVLGLPRGGVVVAAEVARELGLPLDVLVVRKIGHPLQREFAIGALAEPDFVFLNGNSPAEFPAERAELDRIIAEEKERLRAYRARFHLAGLPVVKGRKILIVDDGLATGATAEAAAISLREQGANQIIVSAPVASTEAVERLQRVADAVEVLSADPSFRAVGQFYRDFFQTTDEEVVRLLGAAGKSEK